MCSKWRGLPMRNESIYFDYNATTPLDSGILSIMIESLKEDYGNPSSIHHIGQKARYILDSCRDRIAGVWKCKPSEVIFTSGGTESNNLALFGVARQEKSRGKHIITSNIEHHAVLHALEYLEKYEGFEITCIPVNSKGFVEVESVRAAIRPDTILVSIMAANNEIGTIQPVNRIGKICQENGILFHTDAVQWFGKEPVEEVGQFHADLVSVCGHKFHGPKGVGALFIRSPLLPHPIHFGGAHENERRAGTENLPGIIGFTEAVERFTKVPVFDRIDWIDWRLELRSILSRIEGISIRSPESNCLKNTFAFTVRGTDGMTLIANLDLQGICVSSGSACSAGSIEPSHVIKALGADKQESSSLVRISFGRDNKREQLDKLVHILPSVIESSRL